MHLPEPCPDCRARWHQEIADHAGESVELELACPHADLRALVLLRAGEVAHWSLGGHASAPGARQELSDTFERTTPPAGTAPAPHQEH